MVHFVIKHSAHIIKWHLHDKSRINTAVQSKAMKNLTFWAGFLDIILDFLTHYIIKMIHFRTKHSCTVCFIALRRQAKLNRAYETNANYTNDILSGLLSHHFGLLKWLKHHIWHKLLHFDPKNSTHVCWMTLARQAKLNSAVESKNN